MSPAEAVKPSIAELAERIEADIRARDLQPGDEYYSQAEAKRLLSVGTTRVNRALQLLARRGVLVRKQRKGTFIGNLSGRSVDCPLRRVHLVIRGEFINAEGFFADGHILGIQSQLPQAEIVFNFQPPEKQVEFAEELAQEATRRKGLHGFILASSSYPIQKVFAGCGLPTVVAGSLYPSVQGLPWLDSDHKEEARLMADYLLGRNCKQFIILALPHMMPGDQIFFDHFLSRLGTAGVSCGDLTVRTLSNEGDEIQAHVNALLAARGKGPRKLGIVARTGSIMECVDRAFADNDLVLGTDVELIASNVLRVRDRKVRYPYVRFADRPEERGRMIGELLKDCAAMKPPVGVCRPMELVLPE
jgi:DNA-binding LacI/PurR family transcriptional regulator